MMPVMDGVEFCENFSLTGLTVGKSVVIPQGKNAISEREVPGDILGGTCQVVSGLPKDRDDDAITWMFLRGVGTGIGRSAASGCGTPAP
jgi:hypothetical protein